ncbi:MAG: protein-glutamate O-methyltransferase CheR [Gammaproteobacteria bacterium]|nr:protein-glutamate O-methyltransferase CheR [Gammaproteobacteria bacterium]
MTATNITSDEYSAFQKFLENAAGIVLGDNKHYLVSSRLGRLMADDGIKSLNDLLKLLTRDARLRERVIDAMTTNETSWFRDAHPFEAFKEFILPDLAKKVTGPIRVWSAACSSGQEPYSLSMGVQEYLSSHTGGLRSEVEITATDISPTILEEAKAGVYDDIALGRGLTSDRRARFFQKSGHHLEVRKEIKARVSFRSINLSQNYAALGKFNVILCRNVLIYFSSEMKRDVLQRMANILLPGGYLVLGGSESMANYCDAFQMVRVANGVIYQLKPR